MELQLTKTQRWLILFNVSLSIFMATLDGSIVNIALPVLSKQLHVDISSIQWVVTSYLLTISVLLLIWGKIADTYGRKKIFTAGFIIFTIGSALCGFSGSLAMLIFSRVIQALGASAIMALSQGIVTATFPPEERGRALGITGTTVALGGLVGPSLGGVLVHAAGWQSIFYINIPIGIIGTVLTLILIPDIHETSDQKKFDYIGAILFVVSITLLFMGLLLFQEGSLAVVPLVIMLAGSVGVLQFFIRYEYRMQDPLIDLKLFTNPVFSLGLSSGFLSFIGMYASILFLPFYLQNILKLDILAAGLLMSFYPASTAIVAPISGWLSDRVSYRPLTTTGLVTASAALAALSTLNQTSSHVKVALLLVTLGVGMALFQSPNNSSIMGSVPRNRLGVAGGINALFRNLGMVTGITLSVVLFTFTTKISLNDVSSDMTSFDIEIFLRGFKVVLLAAAGSCFTGFLISLIRAVRRNS